METISLKRSRRRVMVHIGMLRPNSFIEIIGMTSLHFEI